ncbi:hypothetical protein Ga0466249_001886 [Sporomusaceae bacterium BoRhaA]|uniref:hypothetical protein n=1 Tax=Pelorhabdus rhamnosifermentans TaxID=2772457 RepID=UPI001C05F127|nr:hypothetical protein [Pelorhabdus rhamnosifermentans]MBU2700781.1 hypothetical protein [Pelorhabdus rhamnosifermentans]
MSADQETVNQALQSLGKAINWHNVTFKPYEFKDILAIRLTQGINEHARLFISGTLTDAADKENKDYVQTTDQDTSVSLKYTDATGAEKCLFQGIVTNIKQRTTAGLKHLDIEAVSFSYQLDVKKHSRSFQRQGEPYSYIFQRVNDLARQYVPNLKDDVVKAEGGQDEQITGRLIVQYQETDWSFLKRLASHFNIGLTPDTTLDSPKVYFGLPPELQQQDGQAGPEFNVSAYQIRRDTAAYATASSNSRKNSGVTFSENDFTYCGAQSLDILQLGQQVTFLGLTWYVKNICTIMEKGAVNSTYTLATKQGLMQDDLYNTKLAGISLHGIVKEVTKDQVKVHITDIDETWDDGATWYFPYTTVYSSPDGSGWYCMPEVGDNVRVYFSNNREEQAVAASSVNLTPYKRGQRSDPDSKVLSTVYGKQVLLTPGGIQVIANDNLLMTLTDDGGVSIKSDKKIILEAEKDIEITSKTSKVLVTGQEEVSLKQGSSEINIQEDINIKGNKVKIQP